jgi:hypothetical protein
VWGSSGSDVFVVGSEGKPLTVDLGGYPGRILHYDGRTSSPVSGPATDWLNTIWGSSSSDVFAAGYDGTILHYDGSAWSPMSSGTYDRLLGVWGSSGSDIFAVGDGGTILHYDGSAWSPISGSGN